MRRFTAVMVLLLTASAALAGMEGSSGVEVIVYGYFCCGISPLVLIFVLAITLAIYDWRKARRPTTPAEDE